MKNKNIEIPIKTFKSIPNHIDHKSYGKMLENGINIKVESVEDIQTIDNC